MTTNKEHKKQYFATAKRSGYLVVVNQERAIPLILQTPTGNELDRFMKGFEEGVLDRFWKNRILTGSPFDANLPYGLACSDAGHSAVDSTVLLQQITGTVVQPASYAKTKLLKYKRAQLDAALAKLQPQTVEEARKVLSSNGWMRLKTIDLRKLASENPRFEDLIAVLWNMVTLSAKAREAQKLPLEGKRTAINVLISMRSQGWLLCPSKIVTEIGHVLRGLAAKAQEWDWTPDAYLSGGCAELFSQLSAGATMETPAGLMELQKCRLAILCSSLNSKEDLTLPLVETILRKDFEGAGTERLRTAWTKLCEANGPEAMVEPEQKNDHRGWLNEKSGNDPRLVQWVDVLAKYCELHTAGQMEPLYKAFVTWLQWLSSLETIPAPEEVKREHIRDDLNPDAYTFYKHVAQLELANAKDRNLPLKKMSDFFEALRTKAEREKREFQNPVRFRLDRLSEGTRSRPGGTTRDRIPNLILDELRTLIVRKDANGQFHWADEVRCIEMTWIKTNDGERVFCPIKPAIVYLMLVYPLRSHQVRWLDSGELDAVRYDFDKQEFLPNPRCVDRRRSAGVLQAAYGDAQGMDFQVCINKTVIEQRRRSNYIIPFVTEDVKWVIREVLKWQAKYGAPPTLVREVHEPVVRRRRNQRMAPFFPEICPLFRTRDQKSFYPPPTSQLGYFWGRLCGVWDSKRRCKIDPATGTLTVRAGLPKLSRTYQDDEGHQWDVANFNLHSLRVAGVSRLLDAGVPLGVVASVAGHRSLAMTIYYFKAEREVIRVQLAEAFEKIGTSKDLEKIEKKINELDEADYPKYFKGTPEGFKALRACRATGNWIPSLSGICPGVACEVGLPEDLAVDQGRAVPGAFCALCRFRIYGPAFLPGIVHEANCLLFGLEQKANRQVQLREDIIKAEDEGRNNELRLLRGEEDALERETRLDLRVLSRLHSMAEECVEMLAINGLPLQPQNNGDVGKTAAPAENAPEPTLPQAPDLIIQHQQEEHVGVWLERISSFTQWKNLVHFSMVVPVGRQAVADDALLRMQEKILECLVKNGMRPYLITLPKELKRRASVQWASLLEALVPDEDQREKVLNGDVLFSAIPRLEAGINMLVDQAEKGVIPVPPEQLRLPETTSPQTNL